MSNTYPLTQQIHTEIKRIKPDYELAGDGWYYSKFDGVPSLTISNGGYYAVHKILEDGEIFISDRDFDIPDYDEIECTPALNPENITQLLVDFQGLLGDNPTYNYYLKDICAKRNLAIHPDIEQTHKDRLTGVLENTPKTLAKALCSKWFLPVEKDGIATPSLWVEDQEQVLKELLEILKNI